MNLRLLVRYCHIHKTARGEHWPSGYIATFLMFDHGFLFFDNIINLFFIILFLVFLLISFLISFGVVGWRYLDYCVDHHVEIWLLFSLARV